MQKEIKYDAADWRADFDSVRMDQMLRFQALPLRDKIKAMEDMAEFVEHVKRIREQARAKTNTGK